MPHLDSLAHDIRHGVRGLRRQRVTTLLAIGILAVAIASTTAIFTIVNSLLVRGLPFERAEEIAIVWDRFGANSTRDMWLSMPEYVDLRDRIRQFREVAALTDINLTMTGGGDEASAERLQVIAASSSLWPLLRVSPIAGRTMTADDDTRDARRVVMLSHELWQRRFAGDRGAIGKTIGKTIVLDDRAYEIIGVLPPGFHLAPMSAVFPANVDAWVAIEPHTLDGFRANRTVNMLHVLARLQPSATLASAQAAVDVLVRDASRQYPQAYGQTPWHQRLVPLQAHLTTTLKPVLTLLMAATGLLLAIAIANVASLLLSQAAARQREMAIKAAIGAGRARLIRQCLIESLLLGGIAGAAGVLLAAWSLDLLTAWAAPIVPLMADVRLDSRLLLFAAGVSMLSALLFGFAPAL
jgi:predicted permease